MNAKPTKYGGTQFRSQLEARWAVFFDQLHIEWEYEPESFQTPWGLYCPDFFLPQVRMYAEVKPSDEMLKPETVYKCNALTAQTHNPVLFLIGAPADISYGASDGQRYTLVLTDMRSAAMFTFVPGDEMRSLDYRDAVMAAQTYQFDRQGKQQQEHPDYHVRRFWFSGTQEDGGKFAGQVYGYVRADEVDIRFSYEPAPVTGDRDKRQYFRMVIPLDSFTNFAEGVQEFHELTKNRPDMLAKAVKQRPLWDK